MASLSNNLGWLWRSGLSKINLGEMNDEANGS